jgi:CheY-like chemotaxis protein
MDGWSVLTELKKDPDLSHVPILLCMILDDRNLGFALGASEFLTKPVDRNQLVAMLRKHAHGRSPGAPGRVLLVEDEPVSRQMLARLMQKEGWAVSEAENGKVALERLERERPGLILLDLMMPVLDGFEFVNEMRKIEANRAIPIIVVTAMDLTPEDHRRLSGHVEAILRKGGRTSGELLREISVLVGPHAEGGLARRKRCDAANWPESTTAPSLIAARVASRFRVDGRLHHRDPRRVPIALLYRSQIQQQVTKASSLPSSRRAVSVVWVLSATFRGQRGCNYLSREDHRHLRQRSA